MSIILDIIWAISMLPFSFSIHQRTIFVKNCCVSNDKLLNNSFEGLLQKFLNITNSDFYY